MLAKATYSKSHQDSDATNRSSAYAYAFAFNLKFYYAFLNVKLWINGWIMNKSWPSMPNDLIIIVYNCYYENFFVICSITSNLLV